MDTILCVSLGMSSTLIFNWNGKSYQTIQKCNCKIVGFYSCGSTWCPSSPIPFRKIWAWFGEQGEDGDHFHAWTQKQSITWRQIRERFWSCSHQRWLASLLHTGSRTFLNDVLENNAIRMSSKGNSGCQEINPFVFIQKPQWSMKQARFGIQSQKMHITSKSWANQGFHLLNLCLEGTWWDICILFLKPGVLTLQANFWWGRHPSWGKMPQAPRTNEMSYTKIVPTEVTVHEDAWMITVNNNMVITYLP